MLFEKLCFYSPAITLCLFSSSGNMQRTARKQPQCLRTRLSQPDLLLVCTQTSSGAPARRPVRLGCVSGNHNWIYNFDKYETGVVRNYFI